MEWVELLVCELELALGFARGKREIASEFLRDRRVKDEIVQWILVALIGRVRLLLTLSRRERFRARVHLRSRLRREFLIRNPLMLLVDETGLQFRNAASIVMRRWTLHVRANTRWIVVVQTRRIIQNNHIRISNWSLIQIRVVIIIRVVVVVVVRGRILKEEFIALELLIGMHCVVRGVFLEFFIHNRFDIHLTRWRWFPNWSSVRSARIVRYRIIIVIIRGCIDGIDCLGHTCDRSSGWLRRWRGILWDLWRTSAVNRRSGGLLALSGDELLLRRLCLLLLRLLLLLLRQRLRLQNLLL